MRVFSFDSDGHSDGDEVPPEVEAAMESLAEALTEHIMDKPGFRHEGDDEKGAEFKADHDKFDQLQAHLEKAKGTSVSTTDGYKLRVVAYTALMDDIGTDRCIHDNKMADDLLAMADRLDELDLKESVIGA